MAVLRSVKNSSLCFGCGSDNAAGLQLEFDLCEDNRTESRFTPRPIHGGWKGVFHGGLMATLLDEVMLAHLYLRGTNAATAKLEVRYREAVQIGEELLVAAWEVERRRKRIEMVAEAWLGDRVVARARAYCLPVTEKETREGASA